ncbi:hypothetical protein GH714_023079 [Hevea brasiliensis]|uniref:Radical SAM core domain-containing protein n=1 Tax=Hevea brasiliensis TaxID=3981 RepID=A0A6A6KCY3_HEVBR|nr:hypothetical protein GH714_022999 [Hevea brasiliensis]KAF2286635.1 hypothetical protein GH714_023079 [Hevea brasiliensis]
MGNGDMDAISQKGAKVLLKGMRYCELEQWVQSHGFRPGQAMMLWKRLYAQNIWAHYVDELEVCSCWIYSFWQLHYFLIDFETHRNLQILFRLDDQLVIETVIIPCDRGRTTVCVSSQVGCAMNCQFCYTGRMGLKRHLTTAEIVDQVVFAQRLVASEVGSITNVVFMGMGEPLQNIENVIKAADIMVHDQGLHFSPRKVRNWIMPINRKYNLSLLLDTLRKELQSKRISKFYLTFLGFNCIIDIIRFDHINLQIRKINMYGCFEDAKRLIDLVQGIPCKINLIQFNPHCGSQFRPTSSEKMIEFRNILAEAKCTVFLRHSRGDDQMAACGQLGKPGAAQAPFLRVPQQFQMAVNA